MNRMAARSGGIRAEPGRVEGSGAPPRAARETPMDEIAIRTATLDDLETIVDFNARLADESEGLALDRRTLRDGVRAVLSQAARGSYHVACDGGVVGQMMHTREWSDWRNGDLWWIQSVYVRPDYRRRGVCRALYAHLKGLAAADPGVVGLRLYVERGNAAARAAYARLDMRDAGYVVMQDLFGGAAAAPAAGTGSTPPADAHGAAGS